jgi:uncharacterized protein (TIGR02391 family)
MIKQKENISLELNDQQKRKAILQFKSVLELLQRFDVTALRERKDPEVTALESQIRRAIESVYPQETSNWQRLIIASNIDTATISMRGPTPVYEVMNGYLKGLKRAFALIKSEIDALELDLSINNSMGEESKVLRAFEGLDLHHEIERAAGKLYRDGHYSNAVEDACKALNQYVVLRSGKYDLDGKGLMTTVFSKKNPILAFNNLSNESDENEQQGLMHLFEGVMIGFRNPRAHTLIQDDPERALEMIAFISFLAKMVDQAKKVPY